MPSKTWTHPLVQARLAKLAALKLKLGQPVTVGGVTLAVDEATQTQLNHFVTLLSLARDQQPDDAHRAGLLGVNVSALTGPVIDADGHGHDMTVTEAFALVLGYGQAYGAARGAYLTAVAAVAAAKTVSEVDAVGEPPAAAPATTAPASGQ